MLLLNVPYAEKDQAKELGARWNPMLKKWYVEKKKDYLKLKKWFPDSLEFPFIICDFIYIVEAHRKCFRCKKETPVITFAVQNFFVIEPDPAADPPANYYDDYILLTDEISEIPEYFYANLKKRFNYYYDYSKTIKDSYHVNHCKFCNRIQGAFYLYKENNSPFLLDEDNIENLENIIFYKVPLEYDLFCDINFLDFFVEEDLFRDMAKQQVILFEH